MSTVSKSGRFGRVGPSWANGNLYTAPYKRQMQVLRLFVLGAHNFADLLRSAVEDGHAPEAGELEAERLEERGERRTEAPEGSVLGLDRDPQPVRAGRAQEALGTALRGERPLELHQRRVVGALPADQLGVRAHDRRDAGALLEPFEVGEHPRRTLERHSPGDHSTAVNRGRNVSRVQLGCSGHV